MVTYIYSHIVRNPETKVLREYIYHSRLNIGDPVYIDGQRWIVVSKNYQQEVIMKDKILNAAFYITVAAAVCMIIKAWSILLEVEWI